MENFVADAIYIDATAERVFAALLDPDDALVWMDGKEARIAAGAGGEFVIRRADGSSVAGTITEFAPGQALTISEYWWEHGDDRRGPMSIRFTLEPRDDGIWIVVRQDGLDAQSGWEAFALDTRQELIASTVALKRHIEGI
jgi:uncharacterized protein YndB with AHSA1/START domain